jgi:hypothetical protein
MTCCVCVPPCSHARLLPLTSCVLTRAHGCCSLLQNPVEPTEAPPHSPHHHHVQEEAEKAIRARFTEMGLVVRVENAFDNAEAEGTLLGAIFRSLELVPQPSMSLEVLRQLMARNHHAGHQVGMQRGTHQKTGEHGLESFKAEAGELSQFLHALDNSVTAGGWQLHNQFANINRGGPEQPADDASMVSEEVRTSGARKSALASHASPRLQPLCSPTPRASLTAGVRVRRRQVAL